MNFTVAMEQFLIIYISRRLVALMIVIHTDVKLPHQLFVRPVEEAGTRHKVVVFITQFHQKEQPVAWLKSVVRKYTGNVAGNVRTVFVNGFESSTNPTDDWTGGTQSNNALNLGGHSLQSFQDVTLSKTVGTQVERNLSYTVSFLAKAQTSATSVNSIDFINKEDETAVFDTSGSSISNSEWKLYTFNLSNLNHEITPAGSGGGDAGPGAPEIGEKLRIRFNAPVFVDNIRLTEVPNRYYLIKD